MDKILIIIVLFGLGIFFIGKMFNPPVGPKYKLKSILFNPENSQISQEFGRLIFISKGKRKIILPTEFDLWAEAKLFENGIVLKKNKKERTIFFGELSSIEPFLVNSLFVKGKYFGYSFILRNKKEKIDLKSCDMNDLDVFIDELCKLFSQETEKVVIKEVV